MHGSSRPACTAALRNRVRPAYWVEVVLDPVLGHRLHDDPAAVRIEQVENLPGRPRRIAHVVQCVEGGHRVERAVAGIARAGDLEGHLGADPGLTSRARATSIDAAW